LYGFLFRRKGRVTFAADQEREAFAFLVAEGGTGGLAARLAVGPVLEDVKVGNLFRLCRLVFGCGCQALGCCRNKRAKGALLVRV
jgi:hypothetical protein